MKVRETGVPDDNVGSEGAELVCAASAVLSNRRLHSYCQPLDLASWVSSSLAQESCSEVYRPKSDQSDPVCSH